MWMFHNRTLNNKINKLHERALRIVYKNDELTFRELLKKDHSITIHQRNLQRLVIEMYKIKTHLSPLLVQQLFTQKDNTYDLRNKICWETYNVRKVIYGTETIRYRSPKMWELVPTRIRESKLLLEFEEKIKQWKPEGCDCRMCKPYIHNLGFID